MIFLQVFGEISLPDVLLNKPAAPGLETVLFFPATLTKLCRECLFFFFLSCPKAIKEGSAISLGLKTDFHFNIFHCKTC